jgi:hypothetical protein
MRPKKRPKLFVPMDEAAFLLSSPENARHLRESIAQIESGIGPFHKWPFDGSDLSKRKRVRRA